MVNITNYLSILLLLFLTSCLQGNDSIYVSRYKAVMTQPPKHIPTTKTPDGPLAGNGDIGLVVGGVPSHLTFYFGKNDFWRAIPYYPEGGIALPGTLELYIDALDGADYYVENVFDEGYINGRFTKDKFRMEMKAWVSATRNTVVIELQATATCTAQLTLRATESNTSVTRCGREGKVQWVSRSFENDSLFEWPAHVALAMSTPTGASISKDNNSLVLSAGEKNIIAVTIYSGFDDDKWKERACAEAASLTSKSLSGIWKEHRQWWRDFWSKSNVQIGDSLLEKHYYASQYMLASCMRGDKFPPGLWGSFITHDFSDWCGDYHLNYNYQAPFWGCYSSNHIDLTESFDQPLLDYMSEGRRHARELLGMRGIYYPVGIGPKGLCTSRWSRTPDENERIQGIRDNTIDGGYQFWGQKTNAVFSVGNMLMRYYSTYDAGYARKIYPYMLACADFWEDYLTLEDGRYVIYMDHFWETPPWDSLRLGDFNPTLSLGFVRMLFKGILDVSNHLHTDVERQAKWQDICNRLAPYPTGITDDGRIALKSIESHPVHEALPTGLNRVSIQGLVLVGGVCGPYQTPDFNKMFLSDYEHRKDRYWSFEAGGEAIFAGAARVGYDPDSLFFRLKEGIAVSAFPNLWINFSGGGIETFSIVPMTVNEMLLQSYEHVIRVFPVWNRMRNASFENLRAYGAFLVSSSLKNGKVEYVRLLSEQGRRCRMENPWKGKKVQVYRKGAPYQIVEGDVFEFDTFKGEEMNLKEIIKAF